MEFDLDRESPFQPGVPVSPDNFMGRQNTIKKILRYTNKVIKGQTQHFFLTGKRRMGKTSVADYVKEILETEMDMITVYVSNKGNDSIEVLTSWIIEALINKFPKESRVSRIKKWFGNHVKSIEIQGNKITFQADEDLSKSFKNYFIDYLKGFIDEFPKDKKGIFIIIDDINGLSESREFADWYKKTADTIAVEEYNKLPVYFLLASYPEKFDKLVQHEESFGSIFHHDFIEELSDKEVSDFFTDTFNKIGIEISHDALEDMVKFSSGMPLMMQQIGESVFWQTENNIITQEDAKLGIINAANEIGFKQIRVILNLIPGKYLSLLQDLTKKQSQYFKKEDIPLDGENLSSFLFKMVDLEIFEQINDENYDYKFSNSLYYNYFLIKSFE